MAVLPQRVYIGSHKLSLLPIPQGVRYGCSGCLAIKERGAREVRRTWVVVHRCEESASGEPSGSILLSCVEAIDALSLQNAIWRLVLMRFGSFSEGLCLRGITSIGSVVCALLSDMQQNEGTGSTTPLMPPRPLWWDRKR